jgi:hypothetical protein
LALFVDSHGYAEIPEHVILRALELAEGQIPHSVTAYPVDYLVVPGGRFWCIVHAPDAAAVARLHTELGFPPPTPMLVDGAEGHSPLSAHDRALILRVIGVADDF